MPIYDYRCTQCGRELEVMHGINDSGPGSCAACGGAMRKALSTPAIHFKGSGWAKKDAAASASRAKATGGAADPTTASEKGTGGTGSADTGVSAGGGPDAPSSADGGTGKTATASTGPKDG